jgi:hypothetical protein
VVTGGRAWLRVQYHCASAPGLRPAVDLRSHIIATDHPQWRRHKVLQSSRRQAKAVCSRGGLRMAFAFHQRRTADEGRIQIARRMPQGGNGIRPARPARPSEIVAQGPHIIRIVLAEARTRRAGACGRDSRCAHSLNSHVLMVSAFAVWSPRMRIVSEASLGRSSPASTRSSVVRRCPLGHHRKYLFRARNRQACLRKT